MNFIDIFYRQLNNREISIFIWAVIAASYGLTRQGFVKNILELLKLFIQISYVFIFELFYLIPCLIFLNYIGYLEIGMLKDSIFIAFTATFFAYRIKTVEVVKNKNYFRNLILENLAIVTIFEFIIGIFTFSLMIELVLVPLVVILSSLLIVANNYEKNKKVIKFLNGLLYLVALIVYSRFLIGIFQNSNDVFNLLNLKIFLFPFILTLLLFPFYYFFTVYLIYSLYLTSWKHVLVTNLKKPEVYYAIRNNFFKIAGFRIYKFIDIYEKIRLKIYEPTTKCEAETLFSKFK